MLRRLKGRPVWYQAWAVAVAAAAVFLLWRVFTGELHRLEYALMVFVNLSVLIDFFVVTGKPLRPLHPMYAMVLAIGFAGAALTSWMAGAYAIPAIGLLLAGLFLMAAYRTMRQLDNEHSADGDA